jgi:hypothetical protein
MQVDDVLVPPNARGEIAALPGPAVLEVIQGRGALLLGRTGQVPPQGDLSLPLPNQALLSLPAPLDFLKDGEMQLVPAGRALSIINVTPHPMVLRLYLFQAAIQAR